MIDEIKPVGTIEAIVDHLDGTRETIKFKNTVLVLGSSALASSLANQLGGEPYSFYISNMVFGDGGAVNGVPQYVNAGRAGLFGTTRANKPVIATVNPQMTTAATFTSVLTFNDANGYTLSEMALVMATGNFFSMATFSGITKTSSIQITFNWQLNFV